MGWVGRQEVSVPTGGWEPVPAVEQGQVKAAKPHAGSHGVPATRQQVSKGCNNSNLINT